MAGYGEAVETIFRILGGGQPQPASPVSEQREVDLFVVARFLWDCWVAVHYLPERTAQQIWKMSPFARQ